MRSQQMISSSALLDRRQFVGAAAAAASSFVLPRQLIATENSASNKFCAFVKFLRSLEYNELAEKIAELGFDGVEVTARAKDSYIQPERASDQLPRLLEALNKHGLELTILTTDIVRAEQPHAESMLRTAAKLGVPRYRLGFVHYDLNRPVLEQLADLQPAFRDIAAMNRDLGIAAVYQNHAGANYVGATLWDLHSLIKSYPVQEVGCVFDIRHACAEAGEAWPVYFNLMKLHLGAVSVKDYVWKGRRSGHVPLGEGRVDPRFFKLLQHSKYTGPISVHVEYLQKGSSRDNLEALGKDLQVLRGWLGEA